MTDVRALIRECAETFRFYEQNHRAKEPLLAEHIAKAERNREMAEKCEAALAEM